MCFCQNSFRNGRTWLFVCGDGACSSVRLTDVDYPFVIRVVKSEACAVAEVSVFRDFCLDSIVCVAQFTVLGFIATS